MTKLSVSFQTLGVVLRDVITGSNSLWVIAESLDAIFDSFADGPLVNVAIETVELLGALQQLKPVLKGRVSVVSPKPYLFVISRVKIF